MFFFFIILQTVSTTAKPKAFKTLTISRKLTRLDTRWICCPKNMETLWSLNTGKSSSRKEGQLPLNGMCWLVKKQNKTNKNTQENTHRLKQCKPVSVECGKYHTAYTILPCIVQSWQSVAEWRCFPFFAETTLQCQRLAELYLSVI